MNCKHCNAELAEDSKFCSSCGKPVDADVPVTEEEPIAAAEAAVEETPVVETPVEEPAPVKKSGAGKIALAVAAIVVVLAVLVAVIVGGLGGNAAGGDGETVAGATDAAVEATIPPDGNPDDATCKGTYTVADEDAIAAAGTVVATMDGRELTVSQLQVYYWTEVMYFLQDYGSYASYLGLDLTQPLDTQICGLTEETMTWQQYFLSCALDTWAGYQSMALEAEAAGLELTEELKADLAGIPTMMEETAAGYGLADVAELMKLNFGAGAGMQDYVDFFELYYTGYMYYDQQYLSVIPTAEEVESYYTQNQATYEESGIARDGSKYMNVRHILVLVEGGTTDEETGETTYSEEEWENCRKAAQELYDQWLAGEATEDTFAEMANQYSDDSDGTDGGLYENLTVDTNFVENFKNWYLDESRQVGDHGLIQTEYGYHVMYFSGSEEIWFATAENDLLAERVSAVLPAAMEKHPAEIDYSAIVLGLVELG